jgi:hypothetical protein
MTSANRTARLTVAASLGFYALVAQTLLFRDFLTVFEGNELGISAFFTSWLLWVALGAVIGRAETSITSAVVRRFRWFVLLSKHMKCFLSCRCSAWRSSSTHLSVS